MHTGSKNENVTPLRGRKKTWTSTEDEKLKGLVIKNDGKNWNSVVQQMPGRTLSQCQYRWKKSLKAKVIKGSSL